MSVSIYIYIYIYIYIFRNGNPEEEASQIPGGHADRSRDASEVLRLRTLSHP